MEGRVVYLELDMLHRDEFGRLLAYVYLDQWGCLMVNLALIATPIVSKREYPGNTRYAELFAQVDQAQPPAPVDAGVCGGQVTRAPGQYGRVIVRTAPGARSEITVFNPCGGPSEDEGLEPKIADQSDLVTWEWKVGTRTTPGQGKIMVTATLCERSMTKKTLRSRASRRRRTSTSPSGEAIRRRRANILSA